MQMNKMCPPMKKLAKWDYKNPNIEEFDQNDNNSEFQVYLLAKPEGLKQYFIEEITYFWVHHRLNQNRQFQNYFNDLKSGLFIKKYPYVDNMLQDIDQYKGNFSIICQVKDLQKILEYHAKNQRLLTIHLFDLQLKTNPVKARNKKIDIKSDEFKSFKRTLNRKHQERNQIETFMNATRITNHDLSDWDISQVNQSRIALKTLLVGKNDIKGKQDFIKLARIVEQQHGKVSAYEENYQINSRSEQAIKWYTKESFYHRLVNNTLKAGKGNPLLLSYIRFPVKQLYNAIRDQYKKKQLHTQWFQCYRGGRISQQQLEYFIKNKGGYIQMQGFLSCSKNKTEMAEFIVNCVFKITVSNLNRDPQWDHGFCFLDSQQLTEYVKEEEVLFNIFSVMEVKDVTKQTFNHKQTFVISLEYGSLANQLYLKKNRLVSKDRELSEVCIKNYLALKPFFDSIQSQVDCFRYFNKYKQVAEYYEALLNYLTKQKKDQTKLFKTYINLGNSYFNLKSYLKARQNFTKAKQLIEPNQNLENKDINLLKIYNGLGMANKKLNNFVEAKSNYLKTINMIETTKNRNATNFLATAFNNLAAILVEENQFDEAKQYYQRALNLLQEEESFIVANIYYNLGQFFMRKQNLKEAIRNFIRSLEIYNRNFGSHEETINCHKKLGQAYLKNGSVESNRHFDSALKLMKRLPFSTDADYFQLVKQIENLKTNRNRQISKSKSSVNAYKFQSAFDLFKRDEQINKLINNQKGHQRYGSQTQINSLSPHMQKHKNENKNLDKVGQHYLNIHSPNTNQHKLTSNYQHSANLLAPVGSDRTFTQTQQSKMKQFRAMQVISGINPIVHERNTSTALSTNPYESGRIPKSSLQNRNEPQQRYQDSLDSVKPNFNFNEYWNKLPAGRRKIKSIFQE